MKTVFLIISVCLLTSVAAREAPVGQSTIVGAVAVDLSESTAFPGTICREEINIRVACTYQKNSKQRIHYYDITTDSLGYFMIPDAPAGQYVLKAAECRIGHGLHFTVASEYGRWSRGERYRYWGILGGFMDRNWKDLMENQFETQIDSGIINLGLVHIRISAARRMSGNVTFRRSPNGDAPWVDLTLFESGYMIDLRVQNDEMRSETPSPALFPKSPVDYFELNAP